MRPTATPGTLLLLVSRSTRLGILEFSLYLLTSPLARRLGIPSTCRAMQVADPAPVVDWWNSTDSTGTWLGGGHPLLSSRGEAEGGISE